MAVKFEPEKVVEPEKAPPAKAAPKVAAKPEPKPEPVAEVVARAGGYVDHGDGDGWVIEEDEA
jgi:hypothetical protein